MEILLTLFFLFSSAKSSEILLSKELNLIQGSKDIDVDWPFLYAEFCALSGSDSKHSKNTLLQRRFFEMRLEIFQAQILEFFSLKPVEAFSALENESGDFGLVLFFIRALIFNTSNDLYLVRNFFSPLTISYLIILRMNI
jgi:hypothetical protein